MPLALQALALQALALQALAPQALALQVLALGSAYSARAFRSCSCLFKAGTALLLISAMFDVSTIRTAHQDKLTDRTSIVLSVRKREFLHPWQQAVKHSPVLASEQVHVRPVEGTEKDCQRVGRAHCEPSYVRV